MNEFLIWIVILATLFVAVLLNNRSHMKRNRDRRHRDFSAGYRKKKKNKNC